MFGPDSTGTFPILGDSGVYHLPLVGHYRHLGGFLHHSGDMKMEVRRRIATAHQTFSQHRKLLFQNPAIPLRKRVELFRCLVLSKFLYATDSWVLHDQKTKDFVHAAILRLYKRLLKLFLPTQRSPMNGSLCTQGFLVPQFCCVSVDFGTFARFLPPVRLHIGGC